MLLTQIYRLSPDWHDKNLKNSIPASISLLSALKKIDMGWNQLYGPIPGEIGSLKTLAVLDLGYNNLTGNIPEKLSSCSDLSTLLLHGNKDLNDHLPEEVKDLENLVWINLPHKGLELRGDLLKDAEIVKKIWCDLDGDDDILMNGEGSNVTKWKSVTVEYGRVTKLGEFKRRNEINC